MTDISIRFIAAILLFIIVTPANAESVYVKYRGNVHLTPFECSTITRSSFIRRVCYDEANEYMIIKLRNNYYHYCEIGPGTVSALMAADSMGRYYNRNIKGRGSDGPFDCRTHRVPNYK